MKSIVFILCSLFLLTSLACKKETRGIPYEAHGISLEIPEGWDKKERPIPGMGVLVNLEKRGEDESGIYSIGILHEQLPATTQIELMKKQLNQNLAMTEVEVEYGAIEDETFNNVKALSCSFEYASEALSFVGMLRTFHCGAKTVYILSQEERSDQANNREGFDLLNRTFQCNY